MTKTVPLVSVSYSSNGSFSKSNALGLWPMQERIRKVKIDPTHDPLCRPCILPNLTSSTIPPQF